MASFCTFFLPFIDFILRAIHKLLKFIGAYKRLVQVYRRLQQRFKTNGKVEEEEQSDELPMNSAEHSSLVLSTEQSVHERRRSSEIIKSIEL